MGSGIEHAFQVEHWRQGLRGSYEVVASATNVVVATWAFWGAVDQKGGSLFAGDQILLRHGARVILTYPPEPARLAASPSARESDERR